MNFLSIKAAFAIFDKITISFILPRFEKCKRSV